jgi:hypothetical protein
MSPPHLIRSKNYVIASPKKNPTHQGLSKSIKKFAQISLKFVVSILLKTISQNYPIFSNSCTISLSITKSHQYTPLLLIDGLSTTILKVPWKALWFGRSQCDEQNKLPSFLHSLIDSRLLKELYMMETHAIKMRAIIELPTNW